MWLDCSILSGQAYPRFISSSPTLIATSYGKLSSMQHRAARAADGERLRPVCQHQARCVIHDPLNCGLAPSQDCCISSLDPVVATGLVNGDIFLHRYSSSSSSTGPHTITAEQSLRRRSPKAASCRCLAFSSQGDTLVAGFDTGSLLQLDAATGKVQQRLAKVHAAPLNRLLHLVHQPHLVAAGDEGGRLSVWDLRTQAAVQTYKKHTDFITGGGRAGPCLGVSGLAVAIGEAGGVVRGAAAQWLALLGWEWAVFQALSCATAARHPGRGAPCCMVLSLRMQVGNVHAPLVNPCHVPATQRIEPSSRHSLLLCPQAWPQTPRSPA